MALGRYDKTITTTSTGQAVPGAIVTINNKPPNGTGLASLFTDRAGTVGAGNPVTADALGRVKVYLKAARYDVAVTSTGGNTDYEDVEIPKGDLSDIGGSQNSNDIDDMDGWLDAQTPLTLAAFKSATHININDQIELANRVTQDDGGGGTFNVDLASNHTAAIANDPLEGMYVTLQNSLVGIRKIDGPLQSEWWGCIFYLDVATSGPFTDTGANLNAALAYARTLVIEVLPSVLNPIYAMKGGVTVELGSGQLYTTVPIDVPETVSMKGKGRWSSGIFSDANIQIVRNLVQSGIGANDKRGITLSHFYIKGDRSQISQVGLDLLRFTQCNVTQVTVLQSGGRGAVIRQGLTSRFEELETAHCVGDGIVTLGGINNWLDTTPTNLPTNNCTFDTCNSVFNDGAGLRISGLSNGNVVVGGAFQINGYTAGANSGYNIHIDSTTFSPNILNDVWVEGQVDAHVYINHATATSTTDINRLKHFGEASVNRAITVNKGEARVERAFGHGTSYPTINGSNKPFRISTVGGGIIRVTDCEGSTITDGNFVEDQTGNTDTGSQQEYLNQPISGLSFVNTKKSTNVNILDAYEEGTWSPVLTTDATDFTSVTYNSLREGTYVKVGRSVTVTGIMRTDAVTVGAASGSVQIGGLPFTSSGVAAFAFGTCQAWATNNPESSYSGSGSTNMTLVYRAAANGATSILGVSDVATGANSNFIRFSGSYIAND